MKRKNKIFGISFIIANLLTICLSIKSNAAMEIKSGTSAYKITADQAYQYCYTLRKDTTTLSKNTLDPHLSLNAEWAAVTYLSLSSYGVGWTSTNTVTNGNLSGVTFYDHNAWMSSICEEADGNAKNSKLYEDSNTKYVEKLKTECTLETTKGLGYVELGGAMNYPSSTYPYVLREGRFSRSAHHMNSTTKFSFRPVIWN